MKKHNIFNLKTILFTLAFILSIICFLIFIKNVMNEENYMLEIINAIFLVILLLLIGLLIFGEKKLKNISSIFISLFIEIILGFNILAYKNIIELPTALIMIDFKDTLLTDAYKWADDKNIKINVTYEYIDNVEEGHIITQDINPNTLLKEIKEINLIVSSGPNYDKELILSNMVGSNIDSLLEFINTNHLNNVNINYEANDTEKDIVISQSTMGEIKRNTSVTFTLSLGNPNSLKPINIEDLTNKLEFDATLYLKRNGINYNLSYEFSDNIKRGYVISQDKEKNTSLTPLKDSVNLVISKGSKIIVPDFSNKDLDDVINWIINNNLKITFTNKYDINIEKDKLIGINFNKDDVIEENTRIVVTLSNGALKVPGFNSFNEFLSWANTYNIKHSEEYEYNDSVSKGNIISMSKQKDEKINPDNDVINIKISYGSPIVIPNFYGKSKGEIQSTCSKIGLSCGFYYTGYSNICNDCSTNQSIGYGNKVVSGTYMNIGLSNGPAKTFNVYIASEWFDVGNSDGTISSLRNKLSNECPNVNFNFEKHPDNSSPAGIIHPNSPIKAGNNSFTQGNTYTIWITS